MATLVAIEDLAVDFPGGAPGERVAAVDGVSLSVGETESVGVVGESGSGKSLTVLAMLALLPEGSGVRARRLEVAGVNVLDAPEPRIGSLRGGEVGLLFQEPGQAMDPVRPVWDQITEAARLHRGLGRAAARRRAAAWLAEVGLGGDPRLAAAYPHQLSGGQRQRVMLAAALSAGPRLLVADEPSSALDPLSGAALMAQLEALREARGLALLVISHDLGLVARLAGTVTVMYAGETVETAPRGELFSDPAHPYSAALLDVSAAAAGARPGRRLPSIPGSVPRPGSWGGGCRFAPRCPRAFEHCRRARPALTAAGSGRWVRCFLHSDEEVAVA